MKTTLFRIGSLWVLTVVLLAVGLPAHAAKHKRTPAAPGLTFQVATNAAIALGTNHSASLSDLKQGDHVVVGYNQENGLLVAHRIADASPQKSTAAKHRSGNKREHRQAAQALLHVQGVVESVNPQAGTLAIAVKSSRRQA